ncbi:YkvA family protein [Arthrobacter sp. NPDC056493]|uniref:YkvA family protein n=1 Tax=Arthrobacter sp. NPDC056493 TaxID=3345839 RepID=UPI0036719271
MSWLEPAIAAVGGVVLVYAVLLVLPWLYARRHPETLGMREALWLTGLPTLERRLRADRSLQHSIRIRLVLLLVYLAWPIDLVPDFLPFIGHADGVIIVAFVLRSFIRTAGAHPFAKHWPVTPQASPWS